jgi:uncharacterized membrane protein
LQPGEREDRVLALAFADLAAIAAIEGAAVVKLAPSWRPLSALLGVAGVLHFVAPKPFAALVPPALGDPGKWVAGSGAAELAVAAGVAVPRLRRPAALAGALLFVAVFPANVQMAVDAFRSPSSRAWKAASLGRLPLQVPLVLWALDVARKARSAGPEGAAHS